MKTITHWDLFEGYLKNSGSWACMLSYSGEDVSLEELQKAVPLLPVSDVQMLNIGYNVYVTFDNRDEAQTFFNTVVGDDGPTKSNPYDGPARVFACWGGPDGLISENT